MLDAIYMWFAFMGEHPILTVILALIAMVTAIECAAALSKKD